MLAEIERFVPIYVDVDDDPDTAEQFGIRSLPTVVFTTTDGRETRRVVGAVGSQRFAAEARLARSAAQR